MSTSAASPPLAVRPEKAELAIPWRLIAVGLLLALAFFPLLAAHARQLWLREHYQFFPFVIAGAAYLAFIRLRGLGPLQPGSRRVSYLLLTASGGLLALAGLFFSPWLGAVAAMATLAAMVYILGGAALLRRLLPVWLFLWLIVPPPFALDQHLVSALQTLTARCGSKVLDAFGIFHVLAGHVVEIGGRRFLVEEACSGTHSFFAVLPATLFFVLWVRRSFLHAAILVAAALAWIVAANVARVMGITVLATEWGIDLTSGWRHEVFGCLVFLVTLGLIASTDRLVLFFTSRAPARRPDLGSVLLNRPDVPRPAVAGPTNVSPTRLPDLRRTALAGWPVTVAFGVLAAAQLGLYWAHAADAPPAASSIDLGIRELGAEALPARWGAWQRLDYATEHRDRNDALGEFSQIWQYRLGPRTAVVSLDYPFAGWHELPICYGGQGWERQERLVHREGPVGGGPEANVVEVKFTKPLEQHGYLLFTVLDARGRPLEPVEPILEGGGLRDHWETRWASVQRLWRPAGEVVPRAPAPEAPGYQVQLFIGSYSALTPDEQRQAREFFRQTWSALRGRCSGTQEGPP